MSEEQITPNNGSYSADSIQVLEGLEAVRKRPAMYIGDISVKGLHHLVYEIVDNSIDEALAGYCNEVNVSIHIDGSITVIDNGRGIPVDRHESGKSAAEVVLTVLHAGGKFENSAYKVSGGLHGVGVSVVNALSETLELEIWRNGQVHQQTYHRGAPTADLEISGTTKRRGTKVTFKADPQIFETTVYSFDTLAQRLRELAFLNSGARIVLTDARHADVRARALLVFRKVPVFQDSTLLWGALSDRVGRRPVLLWSVAAGDEPRALAGHTGVPSALAFSPAGTTLASASADGNVRLMLAPRS